MKAYIEPSAELVRVESADIVTTSITSVLFSGQSKQSGTGDFYDISGWYGDPVDY